MTINTFQEFIDVLLRGDEVERNAGTAESPFWVRSTISEELSLRTLAKEFKEKIYRKTPKIVKRGRIIYSARGDRTTMFVSKAKTTRKEFETVIKDYEFVDFVPGTTDEVRE